MSTSVGGSSEDVTAASEQNTVQSHVWPNKKADYELQDPIGVGATATVYKV
jgi:hypothetical protein